MSRTCSACIEPCGTAHECKDCGTPLCEKVWMPLEGKYFCGNACVVAYNRKKVEEYEEWLEMLPEKGEARRARPLQRSRSGQEVSVARGSGGVGPLRCLVLVPRRRGN